MNLKIISIIALIVIASGLANAAIFSGASMCSPSWHCTDFSNGNCGSRTCIDINICSDSQDKPSEFEICTEGIDSSRNLAAGTETSSNYPEGHFTISYDIIKLIMEQDRIEQRIIIVNSTEPQEYTLSINYPQSYTGGLNLISTTSDTKNVQEIGDFNIIIDTRNIIIGTYIVPITVSNAYNSKTISIIVDVIPAESVISNMKLDSQLKTIGVDAEIQSYIDIKRDGINIGDKIIYSIINPSGNTIYSSEDSVDDARSIRESIKMPQEMSEGYYTLAAKIESESGEYTRSVQFAALPPQKYYPVLQQPKGFNISNILIGLLIAGLLGLFLHHKYTGTSIQSRKFRSQLRWRKESMKEKIREMGNKLRKLARKITGKKNAEDRAELLKQSYEKGYISLREYNTALGAEGYHVGHQSNDDLAQRLAHSHESHHIIDRHEEKKIENKKEERKSEESMIELKPAEHRHVHHETPKIEEKIQPREPVQEYRREERRQEPKIEPKLRSSSNIDKRTDTQAFVLNNGQKLHSIRDLMDSLHDMPQWVFDHHAGSGRNDFANWIGDVFKYHDVAEGIRNAKTKQEMFMALKGYE